MRVARLVYYSPNVDTYVDSIAAIMQHYRPERIEIAFPDARYVARVLNRGHEQADFITLVHDHLSLIGKDLQIYRAAETMEITPKQSGEDVIVSLLENTDLVDITAVPKKLAVEIVSAALKRGSTKVCTLDWLVPIEGPVRLRVGRDPYDYVDLTTLDQTGELRHSYRTHASLLIGMGLGVLGVSLLSVVSRWIPVLAVANEVLVAFSVAAGFAGLYIAVKAK